ncbi:MAG: TonB-dependent receptor [Vicingaceae bacterium]
MKNLIAFVLFGILCMSIYAQTGSIKGKVISGEDGMELIGAAVLIQGTTKGSIVDIDGNYNINGLNPGNYKLICSYISYKADTIDINIKNGETVIQNFTLNSSSVAIKTFSVEERAKRSSENYMLKVKQKSTSVMEGITAQEINKRGDGNAAGALKRVTGISVVDGKYVYVRGLSDRYSKTTLNGAEIPGLDPNSNAVRLDLFPTNMIENMTIIKSFTPDLPGSFTGGLVNIETKDFPDKFTFRFSSQLSYNSLSSFNNNLLTYSGGKTDWLGMDDGSREISQKIKSGNIPNLYDPNDQGRQELMSLSKSLNKEMSPKTKNSFLDQKHTFSFGDKKSIYGKELGYIIGFSYQKSYNHYDKDAITRRYDLTGNYDQVDELVVTRDLKDTKSEENVVWGILANVSYKISPNNKIAITGVKNQKGIKSASFQQGTFPGEDAGLYFQTRSLGFTESSLTSGQVKGEHFIEKWIKLKVKWLGAYSKSYQNQPDLRFFSNDFRITNDGDTTYSINAAAYPEPTRYYRTLNQTTKDYKMDFELVIKEKNNKKSLLKFGAAYLNQDRVFNENRINYERSGSDNFNGNVTDYLSNENMTFVLDTISTTPLITELNGLYIQDATEKRNNYVANQNIAAGYLMGDVYLTNRIRSIIGVRYETTDISTSSRDTSLRKGVLNQADLLPSINLIDALNEKTNIRAIYSKTLARPTFREVAPFATYDFATDWIIVGNDSLDRTLIDNFDLRYELFPNVGEIISFSVYYKNFTNPIERVFNTKAANAELTWRNQDRAIVYGAEFEFRKQLNFLSDSINKFSLGGNFSYIQSKVDIDGQEYKNLIALNSNASTTRQMFGQSPYIVNAFVEYKNDSLGLMVSLSYNVAGPKIAVVYANGLPNVYEQPANQLDVTLGKKLSKRFNAMIKARNILDPIYKQTQTFKGNEYIFNAYRKGRIFSLSLSYSF